jgi:hypothetical protein
VVTFPQTENFYSDMNLQFFPTARGTTWLLMVLFLTYIDSCVGPLWCQTRQVIRHIGLCVPAVTSILTTTGTQFYCHEVGSLNKRARTSKLDLLASEVSVHCFQKNLHWLCQLISPD